MNDEQQDKGGFHKRPWDSENEKGKEGGPPPMVKRARTSEEEQDHESEQDIIGVIEKLIPFVARHGAKFERKVLEKNENNEKFSFLVNKNPSDPAYRYYLRRLEEATTGGGMTTQSSSYTSSLSSTSTTSSTSSVSSDATTINNTSTIPTSSSIPTTIPTYPTTTTVPSPVMLQSNLPAQIYMTSPPPPPPSIATASSPPVPSYPVQPPLPGLLPTPPAPPSSSSSPSPPYPLYPSYPSNIAQVMMTPQQQPTQLIQQQQHMIRPQVQVVHATAPVSTASSVPWRANTTTTISNNNISSTTATTAVSPGPIAFSLRPAAAPIGVSAMTAAKQQEGEWKRSRSGFEEHKDKGGGGGGTAAGLLPTPRSSSSTPPPMPPKINQPEPAVPQKRGHHIGDFLPKEELVKYLPPGTSAGVAATATDAPPPEPKIDESNIGHKLLQKMGWKGKGLGSQEHGTVAPIEAKVKNDTLGIGMQDEAANPNTTDQYELYRQRMMRAYRYRPNPLNNPRHQYY